MTEATTLSWIKLRQVENIDGENVPTKNKQMTVVLESKNNSHVWRFKFRQAAIRFMA